MSTEWNNFADTSAIEVVLQTQSTQALKERGNIDFIIIFFLQFAICSICNNISTSKKHSLRKAFLVFSLEMAKKLNITLCLP